MNDRIKDLAEQAGIDLYGDTGVEATQANLQEFAELVVQECADFVATALVGKIGQISAAVVATDLVEHFGVE